MRDFATKNSKTVYKMQANWAARQVLIINEVIDYSLSEDIDCEIH